MSKWTIAVRWLAVGSALVIGAYLLVWAWRWPHPDMRNAWASAGGLFVLVVGGAAALAVPRWGRWQVFAVVAAVLAAAFGVLVLGVVSSDQEQACGDRLEACGSLLPGL